MVGHKTSLNRFIKIEIIADIFSDIIGLKLETNFKRKTQKHLNTWKLNSMLLNNEWANNENKKETKNIWKQMIMNTHTMTQPMGHCEGSPEREIHSDIDPPKEERKISNKQLNPTKNQKNNNK